MVPEVFETVYEYTLQAVKWFFEQGCELVILACNTASAKALRTIQQNDLLKLVLKKGSWVLSDQPLKLLDNTQKQTILVFWLPMERYNQTSYPIEIAKFFPHINVHQQACPLWVPLIENNEYENDGADFFYKKNIGQLFAQSNQIDTVSISLYALSNYKKQIQQFSPKGITILSQGEIVANSYKII